MVLKNVLLTGATGMMGQHILAALRDTGCRVTAMSRRTPELPSEGTEWHTWNLEHWYEFETSPVGNKPLDVVIHAGASVPGPEQVSASRMFAANVTATVCIGEWAFKNRIPLVYLSGAVVYREEGSTGIDETAPVSPSGFGGFYRTTKLLGEQALAGLADDDSRLVILRPSSIYGEGLAAGKMIDRFLCSARSAETIEITPPWNDEIDMVHAADVAAAALQAIEAGAKGVFNIGGYRHTVEDIANACVSAASSGHVVRTGEAQKDHKPFIRFGIDSSKAAASFGYRPSIGLESGIRMMNAGIFLPDHRGVA